MAPSLSLTLSRRDSYDPSADGFSAAGLSPEEMLSLDINLEALETPSDSETGSLPDNTHEWEWEGETDRERERVEVWPIRKALLLNLTLV